MDEATNLIRKWIKDYVDRLKNLLRHFLNVVVAMILVVGIMLLCRNQYSYDHPVINDLRLDTYVTFQTGLGIVMLMLAIVAGMGACVACFQR